MMKDTKSSTVKKALEEESIKLSALAREHIQNTERKVNRKKLNPLETMRGVDNLRGSNLMAKTRIQMKMERGLDEGTQTRKGGTPIWGRNKRPRRKLDQAHFWNFKDQSENSEKSNNMYVNKAFEIKC